jgi:hypothetical protein
MTACRCTHEQGDTDCEKHPHCNNCGESVESMRIVADYRAVEKFLDSANVPWFVVEGTTATLAERVALLARDRDEARALMADTAHKLANEQQVTQDLREQIAFDTRCERVAERLVFAMWIHAAYRVDSRGPSGCLMDALDIIAPDVAAAFRKGIDGHDVYAKFYGSEDDEEDVVREEAPTDTPIGEMLANVVELHALRNAPTDVQGIESTVDRLISATHALAIAANDTRERLMKLEQRVAAKDTTP